MGLSPQRIVGTKLFLYTQKTQVSVFCPLPEFVVETPDGIAAPGILLWTGDSKIKSAEEIGNVACGSCVSWRLYQTVTHTGSETPLQLSFYLQVSHWSGYLFCWGIVASR